MNTTNINVGVGRVMGLMFIIAGGLLAIVGMAWLLHTVWFVSHATKASGQVIAMKESHDSNSGDTTYHPLFTFPDAGGIIHTQLSSFSSSDYSFEVGEKVTILYDSRSPKHSMIDSFQTVWLGPLCFTLFGLLFAGSAYAWSYLWNRMAKQKGHDAT